MAGGDSFTDRGVYDTVVRKGKGVDYPFDGGTAKVTGHGCCDPVFNDNIVPRYVLTGNKGAVRRLFKGAELAIANHEQPVTEVSRFHSSGTRFSGKPALTSIFTRAGIDYLSLANNHIKDYGADGIRDTRRILRQNDIAFGGAGKDLAQARKITYLEGRRLDAALIIPCLDIVKIYWADPSQSGATPCLDPLHRARHQAGQAQGRRGHRLSALGRGVHAAAAALDAASMPSVGRRPAPTWSWAATATSPAPSRNSTALRCCTRSETSSSTSTGRPTRCNRRSWRRPSTAASWSSSGCGRTSSTTPASRTSWTHAKGAGRRLLKSVQQASSDWLDW